MARWTGSMTEAGGFESPSACSDDDLNLLHQRDAKRRRRRKIQDFVVLVKEWKSTKNRSAWAKLK